MSKHRKQDECCYPMYGAYTMGYSTEGYGESLSMKWFYALLLLIVIVLQFGRREKKEYFKRSCADEEIAVTSLTGYSNCNEGQLIDNSVLFIIIVFLLVLCAGCWRSDSGYGYGGGFFF